jgi:hypothetical protein
MAERRPLIAGLKPAEEVNPALEKEFVYGAKAGAGKHAEPEPAAEGQNRKRRNGSVVKRVPLTTRIREDFEIALTRACLERKLNGVFPNAKLEILEEALEPWLRTHGYIQ